MGSAHFCTLKRLDNGCKRCSRCKMQIYDMLYSIVGIDYHKNEPCQRELVGARPLHLAYARPFCRLKAPLGLSLLRCAAQTRTCRGEAPPSCCARPFCHSNTPLGCLLLRKRELLRTRHFRQDARKSDGNFSKKREGRTVPALLTRQQQPKSFVPIFIPVSSRFAECPCNPKGAVL